MHIFYPEEITTKSTFHNANTVTYIEHIYQSTIYDCFTPNIFICAKVKSNLTNYGLTGR